MKTLQSVQRETFLPYGEVLEFPAGIEETFCIITTEEKEPWRLAVFRYTNKEIQRMECHPTSRESFEPLHGLTVLVVAKSGRIRSIYTGQAGMPEERDLASGAGTDRGSTG